MVSEIMADEPLDSDEVTLDDIPDEPESLGMTARDLAEAGNIASLLDETELMRIGEEAKSGLDIDEDSRSEWMERHEAAMNLALQVGEDKTYPWEGASNFIFPLITTGALQFQARALPAIIPGNNIVKCRVNGDDSGQFEVQIDPNTGQPQMNPQTGEPVTREIVPPGFKAEKAARVAQHMNYQLLDEMKEWYEDTDKLLLYLPIAGCAFRRMWYEPAKIRPVSRFIPASNLVVNMKARSLDDAPRISEKFYIYPYQIVENIRSGEYFYEGDDPYEDFAAAEEEDESDSEPSICLVEQQCRLDLDEDGYSEPYTVIFHEESGRVLKITARYALDDIVENDFGEIVRINTMLEYVKYDFIPNPDNGFYGIGLGWLLGPINEQVNTTVNQLNDAASLQNMPMGFLAKGLRVQGGNLRFEPGEFKQVDSAGGNLRDNLYQLRIAEPSSVLFSLLGLMINAGQDISSVKDIMMGDMNKNIAPTTALTLVEQGTTQFNSIFTRVHRALKHEVELLFMINERTLDEQKYFTLFDTQKQVSREDYDSESLDVTPVTDPNMAARSIRSAKVQALSQVTAQYPGRIDQDKVLALTLEALDIENPQEFIRPPPPPPEPDFDQRVKISRAETDQFRAETDRELKAAQAIKELMEAMKAFQEAESGARDVEAEKIIQRLTTLKGEFDAIGQNTGMAGTPGNNSGAQEPQATGI